MNKQLVVRLQAFGRIKKNKSIRVSANLLNILLPRFIDMILIQSMLYASFFIDFVDDLIAFYRQIVAEADHFKVLRHFIEEVLGVGSDK